MADGGCVALERAIGSEIRAALRAKGHILCEDQGVHYGGYQAVLRDPGTGVLWGGTESRVDGIAAGY